MRRVALTLLAMSVMLGLLSTPLPSANAEPAPGTCIEWDDYSGECVAYASLTMSIDPSGSSGDVKIPPRKCFDLGREIPCTTEHGWWHAVHQCYVSPYDMESDPEGRGDPPEGFVWVECTVPREGDWMTIIQLPVSQSEPPPDPRRVAWQLIASLQVRAGEFTFMPRPDKALIGLPHWFWITDPGPQTTGPISKSDTRNGYTVTIEAVLDRVGYDMGNGDTVTCEGSAAKGTKYFDRYGLKPSPTCGYDEGYAERGEYTITAQSFWTVNWYGVGQAGTITLDLSRTAETTVAEKHAVTQ